MRVDARPRPPLMHALWMLASGLAFALTGVCVKLAAAHFATAELVFWRSVLSVAVSALILWRLGQPLGTRHVRVHLYRGVAGFASLVLFFHALATLPVAMAMTLNYTSPLFVALLFPLLARERVRPALAAALAAGFAGTVLLLRPSVDAASLADALAGLASAALAAVAFWNVRKLVDAGEPEERVVLSFALCCVGGALAWMLPARWTPVDAGNVLPLAGVALFGTAGQIFLTRAYGRGNALVAATLSYSAIVFSTVLGYAVFDDRIAAPAWVGMALIVAAGIAAMRYARASAPA